MTGKNKIERIKPRLRLTASACEENLRVRPSICPSVRLSVSHSAARQSGKQNSRMIASRPRLHRFLVAVVVGGCGCGCRCRRGFVIAIVPSDSSVMTGTTPAPTASGTGNRSENQEEEEGETDGVLRKNIAQATDSKEKKIPHRRRRDKQSSAAAATLESDPAKTNERRRPRSCRQPGLRQITVLLSCCSLFMEARCS